MKQEDALSKKWMSRLTLYHSILTNAENKGEEYITSTYMSELLKNIGASLIRKDIGDLSYKGVCRKGYCVKDLKELIEQRLSFSKNKDVYIIGAGNLGFALAKNHNFGYYGFNIKALFDSNDLKVGIKINGIEVHHISELDRMSEKQNVKIAILAVPYENAEFAIQKVVNAGIKYIWNFTEHIASVPEDVHIWNENLIGHFLQLTIQE